jgi:hypothetical protein
LAQKLRTFLNITDNGGNIQQENNLKKGLADVWNSVSNSPCKN